MHLCEGWWIPAHSGRDSRHPVTSQADDIAVIGCALKYVPRGASGRVFVQAGARVGFWPIRLVELGANCVHAFEPDSCNAACASRNIEDRKMGSRINLRQSALGASEGVISLALSDESGGEHHIATSHENGRKWPSVVVTTIDALALNDCAGIFLDVEGYELEVLKGSVTTLMAHKPVIVVEENATCFRYGRQRGDVQRFLEPLGYRLVDEFSLLPVELQRDPYFRGSDLIFARA